ncbi:MAG: penicillin-binding protein 1A [Pseudomonadota bacterium]
MPDDQHPDPRALRRLDGAPPTAGKPDAPASAPKKSPAAAPAKSAGDDDTLVLAAPVRADGPTVGDAAHRGGEGGGNRGGAALMALRAGQGVGFFASLGMAGLIGAMAFAALYLNKLSEDLPDYQVLADYEPPVTTRVYAGNGTLVAEFARERRLFMPIEAIPDTVKTAFVSAEDKSFYEHSGLDMRGIIRAQISNVGNIVNGRRLEGGSTITQQVAKVFLLSSEQKIDRKLKEWLVTRRIEKAFTKDQILELYLNEIYLGNRSYGVAAAALNYFDKSLDDLTVEEAAYLAAIPKGPSNYHPILNKERAIDRRNWVIGRIAEDGHISADEAEAARARDLGAEIAPPLGARDWASEYFAEEVRKQTAELYGVEALYDGGLSVRTTVNPTLQRAAGVALRRWLVEYDQRHGWRGPIAQIELGDDWRAAFKSQTDILADARKVAADLSPWRPAVVLQANAAEARIGFEDGSLGVIPLEAVAWAKPYVSVNEVGDDINAVSDVLSTGDVIFADPMVDATSDSAPEADQDASEEDARATQTARFVLRQAPAANGGLVAVDPHTGRVLAMVGGFSFELSEFNRALQARRQPGSTFKPFVYAAALDSGYTPSSKVLDAPFVAPGVDSWYKPGNYIEGQYGGLSTLRHGIEKSRNTMTARLAQDLGIGRILDYVDRFKLSDALPRELAISLGAGETTLVRITAAYATFVNGGKETKPFFIDRVQDRYGKTIYKHDERECLQCNSDVWSGQLEPQLSDGREQVMDPRTAFQMVSMLEGVVRRGTGSAVRKVLDRPVAGKTGTTNDYKDAWFVGFSPDLAAGVYVGFDLPQSLGRGEAGGTVAAPIFAEFMAEALKDEPEIPFRIPSGIRLVRVNAKTGQPAGPGDGNVILEAFKAEDVLAAGPSEDDFALDPLSAAPGQQPPEDSSDELEGLF